MTIPTASEYKAVLTTMKIPDLQRRMLEAHYRAHNRSITYTQLAKAGGHESYETANRWYGQLGKDLGTALGFSFTDLDERDPVVPFYSSAIGMGMPPSYKSVEEFELVMHHELAKALQQLNWFQEE